MLKRVTVNRVLHCFIERFLIVLGNDSERIIINKRMQE